MIQIHPISDNIITPGITQKRKIATINITNPNYTEIKFQLQISYNYEDEIKLEFTSGIGELTDTSELHFTIDYKEKMIYNYAQAGQSAHST